MPTACISLRAAREATFIAMTYESLDLRDILYAFGSYVYMRSLDFLSLAVNS